MVASSNSICFTIETLLWFIQIIDIHLCFMRNTWSTLLRSLLLLNFVNMKLHSPFHLMRGLNHSFYLPWECLPSILFLSNLFQFQCGSFKHGIFQICIGSTAYEPSLIFLVVASHHNLLSNLVLLTFFF